MRVPMKVSRRCTRVGGLGQPQGNVRWRQGAGALPRPFNAEDRPRIEEIAKAEKLDFIRVSNAVKVQVHEAEG